MDHNSDMHAARTSFERFPIAPPLPPKALRSDNALLRELDPMIQADILRASVPVGYNAGSLLQTPDGDPIFFLEEGLVIEIIGGPGGQEAALRCVGREGLSWSGLLQDPALLQRAHCVTKVRARAVPWEVLADLNVGTNSFLGSYSNNASCEIARNLLSVCHLRIEQRLARWLAMCFQRVDGAALLLTHDALARFLGVRRASITQALHVLEGERAITATRGCIRLRDPHQMRRLAGVD